MERRFTFIASPRRLVWGLCASALVACGGGGDEVPASAPGGRPDGAAASAGDVPATIDDPAAVSDEIRIRYAEGRLSLQVRQRPLHEVLAQIGAQTGVPIVVAPELAEQPLTAQIDKLPLAEALRSLLQQHDLTFAYAAPQRSGSLRAVWVQPNGQGPAARANAAPDLPRAPATAAAAGDARPAALSSAQVLAALARGNAGQRQRALARSAEQQLELPAATLQQLAAGDGDRAVRLLALELLARSADTAALRAVLQGARGDADAAVRERAGEIGEQLERATLPGPLLEMQVTGLEPPT